MKRHENQDTEAMEKDPLWDLIRQSPRPQAGPNFAANTLRAARLEGRAEPAWKRWFAPLALGSLATAAAAVVVSFVMFQQDSPADTSGSGTLVEITPGESFDDAFAAIDESARTEALLVAAENPSDFSDAELVALISY